VKAHDGFGKGLNDAGLEQAGGVERLEVRGNAADGAPVGDKGRKGQRFVWSSG